MPIPALSILQSAAIALPVCLAGYLAQEAYLRRRAVKREAETPLEAPAADPAEAREAPIVTAVAPTETIAAPAVADLAPGGQTAAGAVRGPRRKPASPRAASTSKPTATIPKPATVATPGASRKPRGTRKPAPAETLRAREAALRQGLDAIVAFVDAAPRRAAASACADALLLAIPAGQRGPLLNAFLRGVGAREAPGRLQDLAEEAGVELATALKQTTADLRQLS